MSQYDILFEPVKIGPVTAPNRFIQVPHCNGLGHMRPRSEAANRAIKAEGGWGIVCTQEVEIHPTAEISPFFEGRLWDKRDLPVHRLITDSIHQHGSLAAIELVHMGHHAANNFSRLAPLSVRNTPVDSIDPVNARAMTLRDIRDLRDWHVNAAKLAVDAGYDVIYVYAAHSMSVLMHFLQSRINNRQDEYGGSVKNRVRLVREIIEAVGEAVRGQAAVAFRLAVDELLGPEGIEATGDGAEIVSELAELPDLWDVNVSDWSNDSATARFEPQEGYQLPFTEFVKSLTSKPVVGVGRFTSPDRMVSLIKGGKLDFIGAARPSIADPFLPAKIKSGELEKIRECIGCNICVSSDNVIVPIRCTQNPTSGEEWRKNWHPEIHTTSENPAHVLVVGAGPSGLECALQLTNQGHRVTLADIANDAGGRALSESRLPGLSSYKRVADYRTGLLQTSPLADLHLQSDLTASDIFSFDIEHICIATGSSWHRDGFGRHHATGIDVKNTAVKWLTPDDLLKDLETGSKSNLLDELQGKQVLIYDDDHYYMGGVIAELLITSGCHVTLATPEALVSAWTANTLEQHKIQSKLIGLGVSIQTAKTIASTRNSAVELSCVYNGKPTETEADAICLITSRYPNDSLYQEILTQQQQQVNNGSTTIKSVDCIGDCHAPSTIAAAVYQGHRYARNFHARCKGQLYSDSFEREVVTIE